MKRLVTACLLVGAAACLPLAGCAGSGAIPVPPSVSTAPPAAGARVAFDFHRGLLLNLHHFLYDAARHPERLAQAPWSTPPTDDERAALRAAVDHYGANYARLDPFDDPMVALRHALSVPDDERADVRGLALPAPLAAVLARAAPAYARTLWPAHRAADDAWIAHVRALDAPRGAAIQARLERIFGARFPARVRVDAVADTGTRQGGYTDDPPPQSVLPATRADYGGTAALEMLWHEASHAGPADALEQAFGEAIRAQGRAPSRELWHAAQFWAVGAVVADELRREGLAYEPYADKRGLYAHAWAAYLPLLRTDWQAWVAGAGTRDGAIVAMVARLPPATRLARGG
jgi:hypothetical protein